MMTTPPTFRSHPLHDNNSPHATKREKLACYQARPSLVRGSAELDPTIVYLPTASTMPWTHPRTGPGSELPKLKG